MNNDVSHRVDKITIGKGYNDFYEILEQNFSEIQQPKKLTGYTGYSDASSQYLLWDARTSERLKDNETFNSFDRR